MSPTDAIWFESVQHRNLTLEAFVMEFRQRFAAQLAYESTQFPDIDYDTVLAANLERMYNADIKNIGAIGLSCTNLPSRRCAHPLCPQFMVFDRNVEHTHWRDMGSDILPGHQYRTWVPNMHMRMKEGIHLPKIAFVTKMMAYAKHYVDPQFLPKFETYYNWHYNQFSQ